MPGRFRRRRSEIFGAAEGAGIGDRPVAVYGQLQNDQRLLAPFARRLRVCGWFEADPLGPADIPSDRNDVLLCGKRGQLVSEVGGFSCDGVSSSRRSPQAPPSKIARAA